MKTTVIHHSEDVDGLFCREIARKFLPDAKLIGWKYSEPPLPFPHDQVYVLGLSPNCFADDFSGDLKEIIWIGGHGVDELPIKIPGYRIDPATCRLKWQGVATCRLAWQWFYLRDAPAIWPDETGYVERRVREPLAVRLAGEYDVGDMRDPNAEFFHHGLQYALQHGLRSLKPDQNMWDLMLVPESEHIDGTPDCGTVIVLALIEAGRAIQCNKTQEKT